MSAVLSRWFNKVTLLSSKRKSMDLLLVSMDSIFINSVTSLKAARPLDLITIQLIKPTVVHLIRLDTLVILEMSKQSLDKKLCFNWKTILWSYPDQLQSSEGHLSFMLIKMISVKVVKMIPRQLDMLEQD